MPITIDTTYAGTATNSYVTLEEAIEIVESELAVFVGYGVNVSGWQAVGSPSSETLKRALVRAADIVDQAMFDGSKYNQNQRRAFPRTDTGKPWMDYGGDGGGYPDSLKLAHVAQACELLNEMGQAQQHAADGVVKDTVGDVTVEYRRGGGSTLGISRPVVGILERFGLVSSSGGGSAFMPRG